MKTDLFLIAFTAADVQSVYSGRVGKCCCGCSGKHFYASDLADKGDEIRGYPILPEDVSDRMIAKITKMMTTQPVDLNGADDVADARVIVLETETRKYIAYMRDGHRPTVRN